MTSAKTSLVNNKREIFGWAMFDWAISAFSTTVITVFLGPYLSSITKAAADPSGMVYLLGVPIRYDSYFTYLISASVLLQVTFLPILGALADYSHLRNRLMQIFSTLGAVATILLFFVTPGLHWLGGLLFITANLAFGAAMVFYNSYLPNIASEDQRDRVSAYAWAMGYLGGGLLLVINLVIYLFAGKLGLSEALVARISLASAGVWWLGFSFITFARLREQHVTQRLPPGDNYLTIGFKQLAHLIGISTTTVTTMMLMPLAIPVLFLLRAPIVIALLPALGPIAVLGTFIYKKSKTLPEAMKYLVAYLLYNDGIQTVIAVSAIFAAVELGMSSTNLIMVILMIQFVAFFGALGFARLARRLGTKNSILLSLVIWSACVVYAAIGMKSTAVVLGIEQRQLEFWFLGFVIALVMGGSQALSRSLFAQMIPRNQEAEFYSFYEISERGTSWMGTFLFGLVNQLTGSLRLGIVSVIVFFLLGLVLLPLVNVPRAKEQGQQAIVPLVDGAAEAAD
jgi:MFS transporter, UMF1 family